MTQEKIPACPGHPPGHTSRRRRLLAGLLAICWASASIAQNIEWVATTQGGAGQPGTIGPTRSGIAQGDAGSWFVAGRVGGSNDYRTLVRRVSAAGVEIWQRVFSEATGNAMRVSAVAGSRTGGVYVNTCQSTTPARRRASIRLLDGAAGAVVWQRDYFDECIEVMTVDAAGDLIILGTSRSPIETYDKTVAKISRSDGEVLWSYRRPAVSGINESAVALVTDSAGNTTFALNAESDGTTTSRIVLMKLAGATGTPLWTQSIDQTAEDRNVYAASVAVDSTGNVLVAGSSRPRSGSGVPSTLVDKRSAGGGYPIWSRRLSDAGCATCNDTAVAVNVDGLDDVLVTRSITLATDPQARVAVAKLDGLQGDTRWDVNFRSPGAQAEYPKAATLDAAGNLLTIARLDLGDGTHQLVTSKLGAPNGSLAWQHRNAGSDGIGVTTDAANNAMVLTHTFNGRDVDLDLISMDQAQGLTQWRSTESPITGLGESPCCVGATAEFLTANGDAIVLGSRDDNQQGAAIVSRFSAAGDLLWTRSVGTFPPATSVGVGAYAVDPAGQTYVLVQADVPGVPGTLLKLDGDGQELWQRELPNQPISMFDRYWLLIDASGDGVLFAGRAPADSDHYFRVARFAAADGAMSWTHDFGALSTSPMNLRAPVFDGQGNVIVTHAEWSGANQRDIAITKLSGSTGAVLWQATESTPLSDIPLSLQVNAAGDVWLVGSGYVASDQLVPRFAKFSGVDGARLFGRGVMVGQPSMFAANATLDGDGDLLLVSRSTYTPYEGNALQLDKVSASEGARLWSRTFQAGPGMRTDSNDLVVDESGSAIVLGTRSILPSPFSPGQFEDIFLAAFDGVDGELRWQISHDFGRQAIDTAIRAGIAPDGGIRVVAAAATAAGARIAVINVDPDLFARHGFESE